MNFPHIVSVGLLTFWSAYFFCFNFIKVTRLKPDYYLTSNFYFSNKVFNTELNCSVLFEVGGLTMLPSLALNSRAQVIFLPQCSKQLGPQAHTSASSFYFLSMTTVAFYLWIQFISWLCEVIFCD